MDSAVAVFRALSTPAIVTLLELLLYLFLSFFPKQAQLQDNSSYDVIIVGAGSAGCVLASRLSENSNISVLLIEAGDEPTLNVMLPGFASNNQFSRYDWNLTSVNNSNAYQCYNGDVFQTASGHGLGGGSAINYMLYARGTPNDYRVWAEKANSSIWNYDHVLPYYIKSERMEEATIMNSSYKYFHGTTGPMGVTIHPDDDKLKYLKAVEEVGFKTVLDTNGNYTLGFNFPMYTVAQGVRQSSCYCFVSPVRNRNNLHVMKNTKVTKILLKNNVAVGVQVVTKTNKTMAINATLEVILSAGAFNTPKILMLSGIGPTEHLQSLNITTRKNLPVGYNLQDHIGALLVHQTDPLNVTNTTTNPFKPQENYVNGFIALNESQTYPDAQVLMLSTKSDPGIVGIFAGFDSDIYKTAINASDGREILLTFVVNLRPLSRGRVTLQSADHNDSPKIDLGAFNNKTDVENTIRYVQEFLRIEKSTYFKSVNAQRVEMAGERCKGFTLDSNEYWECYTRCLMVSIFHYSGTCPMGKVVDSRLLVFGIKKLRVVDASVFPIVPSGNTNAPTIMTAEKAADMIKEDHNLTV